MKAWVCHAYDTPFRIGIEDVPQPQCGPGEVLVRVAAAGLNFGETVMLEGRYQAKPPLPYIPISELSGVVEAVGEGVTKQRPGDAVFGFSFDIAGGGLAAFAVLPSDFVFAKPPHMSLEEAAAFPINYWTSFHALLRRGSLKAGETVVVFGAGGGIGLSGVHVASAFGATVIAVAGDDEKLELARQHGASHLVNYRSQDVRTTILELTGGKGADVFLDPVGGDMFEAAMRCVAPAGRILIVGFTSGEHALAKTNVLLVKMASVIGVYAGIVFQHMREETDADFQRMMDWVDRDRIAPMVNSILAFEAAADGLRDIAARRVVGKSVAQVDEALCRGAGVTEGRAPLPAGGGR